MFHWFSTNDLVANAGKYHLLTNSETPRYVNYIYIYIYISGHN